MALPLSGHYQVHAINLVQFFSWSKQYKESSALSSHAHRVGGGRCESKPNKRMKASNTQIQMRKGILECCILHIISREEVYASDMMEELKEANLIIVEGTLYPLLNRLKLADLVSYRWVESDSGPPRKYYSISGPGLDFLRQLSDTWQQLDQSVNAILSKTSNGEPNSEGSPIS